MNDPILVQVGRKWELTVRARALQPDVERALASVADVFRERTSFDPRASTFEVRIAANDYAGATLLLPWLPLVLERAPGLSVRIEPLGPHSGTRLAQGAIDFALGVNLVPPGLGLDRFVIRRVWDDRFVTAMRAEHPSARGKWTLQKFLRHGHVVVETGRGGPASVDVALDKLGKRRRVAASMPTFLLVRPLLEQSDLLATLPARLFAPLPPTLALKEAPVPLPDLSLYLAWHPSRTKDERHRWLRKTLFDAAKNGTLGGGPAVGARGVS